MLLEGAIRQMSRKIKIGDLMMPYTLRVDISHLQVVWGIVISKHDDTHHLCWWSDSAIPSVYANRDIAKWKEVVQKCLKQKQ